MTGGSSDFKMKHMCSLNRCLNLSGPARARRWVNTARRSWRRESVTMLEDFGVNRKSSMQEQCAPSISPYRSESTFTQGMGFQLKDKDRPENGKDAAGDAGGGNEMKTPCDPSLDTSIHSALGVQIRCRGSALAVTFQTGEHAGRA